MKKKKKPGQPTKYKPEYTDLAYKFCLLGATNENLADFFKVNVSTISDWIKNNKEFLEAIKEGREYADSKVAASLYHRALGYSHRASKAQLDREGVWKTHEYIEHYPPDPTSAIFWLKNRQPDKWREKLDIESKVIKVIVADEEE